MHAWSWLVPSLSFALLVVGLFVGVPAWLAVLAVAMGVTFYVLFRNSGEL